jgi:hypothetical protein
MQFKIPATRTPRGALIFVGLIVKIKSCNKKKKFMVYDQNYFNCSTLAKPFSQMVKPLADIKKPHDQLKIGNPLHQKECIRHQIVCNHIIAMPYAQFICSNSNVYLYIAMSI